jgi:hypothetical protein
VQACQKYAVTESVIFQEPTLTPEPIQRMAFLQQMMGDAITVALRTPPAEPTQADCKDGQRPRRRNMLSQQQCRRLKGPSTR